MTVIDKVLIPASSSAFTPLPASDEMPRHRWTRAEYGRLIENGFLEEGGSFELLEGEIIEKMGHSRPHVLACMRCQRLLMQVFGMDRVQSQAPIAPDDYNAPEPDVAVLRQAIDVYTDDAPGPSELLLLVEVSATTQRRDRGVKAAIYARSGVTEYWILDTVARTLTVLREPNADGYQRETTYAETETVAPFSAPDAPLQVAAMLPPPPAASAV